jgi:hypothetical protein
MGLAGGLVPLAGATVAPVVADDEVDDDAANEDGSLVRCDERAAWSGTHARRGAANTCAQRG